MPLVIVTTLPEIEQPPLALSEAVALGVAETVKVDPNAAVAGAPVKPTVCGALLTVNCAVCVSVV